MKTIFMCFFGILVMTFYQSLLSDSEPRDELLELNKSTLFLNYVSAFDTYYSSHANSNGDITKQISLPVWLPSEKSIKMYVDGGYGYVFMPSSKGVLAEVLRATDYSALIGFTDLNSIITANGVIQKPAFIPQGYIVYVR